MAFIDPNTLRYQFSLAMSAMYQKEVPLYGTLLDIVHGVNKKELADNPSLKAQLQQSDELERLDLERHGAIRLGTGEELHTIGRVFAVMGMDPVGYYDLSVAGVPVHSTAFRATDSDDLAKSPFRVFTSLLRLELIKDDKLRQFAKDTLAKRNLFSPRLLELVAQSEKAGGLDEKDADEFITEALKTFSWHTNSPIAKADYDNLKQSHPLIADVVGFSTSHINHLTPRTLDIDKAQQAMVDGDIPAKAIIEGPPPRHCPILLRQTSFKALNEAIHFDGDDSDGEHTARFGEIEERGVALTPKGRALYDDLLAKVRKLGKPEDNPEAYYKALAKTFSDFPDDYDTLHDEGLAFFSYHVKDGSYQGDTKDVKELVKKGVLGISPIVYEDFLPVSAAGIFQSNLGDGVADYGQNANKEAFCAALGKGVLDELSLYQTAQDQSLQKALNALA